MNGIAFLKMHGLGNDFVIIDARDHDIPLSPDAIRLIADRRLGVGCDQFIRMEPSQNGDVFMRIWNPDGSAAEACGNATRCVARLVMDETGREKVDVETVAGILASRQNGSGHVTVDMGGARLGW
ncbi:MAG: diaminopimelate epimerase, partial [Rhodospirillaceae bacterium]|nr:diaminopimelate epimerase [Rhodospirillaceae bacterium]